MKILRKLAKSKKLLTLLVDLSTKLSTKLLTFFSRNTFCHLGLHVWEIRSSTSEDNVATIMSECCCCKHTRVQEELKKY